MGCSSGHLHLDGEFEPTGMAAAFMRAGCPALVANLWDVTDRDIDLFTEEVLNTWTKGAENMSLLRAVPSSRGKCKFQGLTGCAPVYYGLPLLICRADC